MYGNEEGSSNGAGFNAADGDLKIEVPESRCCNSAAFFPTAIFMAIHEICLNPDISMIRDEPTDMLNNFL